MANAKRKREPPGAKAKRKHEIEMLERQQAHERNMLFFEWMRSDPEVKWIVLMFVGLGVSGAAKLLQPPPPPTEEQDDFWQDFVDLFKLALIGPGGVLIENWITGDGPFDNPYQLAAKMADNAGKGLTALSVSMLVMGKIFGTSGDGGGGIAKLLTAVI